MAREKKREERDGEVVQSGLFIKSTILSHLQNVAMAEAVGVRRKLHIFFFFPLSP